jgi:fatty-acyl-CoA synthase
MGKYDDGIARTPVNFVPLSPLPLLERAALVFPDRPAVVHAGATTFWRCFRDRAVKLASALDRRGIGRGETVAALLPNGPAMLEAGGAERDQHPSRCRNGLPHPRPRQGARRHRRPRVHPPPPRSARTLRLPPAVIELDDPLCPEAARGEALGGAGYEAFLSEADPA